MVVCGDHDIVVSRREMGKKEFAGQSVQHRRTNDIPALLGRDYDIGQGLIDKTVDTVQYSRNDFDHWLQYVLAVPSLHNRVARIKIEQQIDSLPGIHCELVDQFNARLNRTGGIKRDLSGDARQDNRIGQ